jgi:hypothetical protein
MPPKTREVKFGPHLFRIAETPAGFEGVLVGAGATRFAAPDEAGLIRKLSAEAMKGERGFVGYDGARARFLRLFPQGFADPALCKDELEYKREMAEWLAREAPLERALLGEADPRVILRAFQRTNLADTFTKAKLGTVLKGARAADLVAILAHFAADRDARPGCEALSREFAGEGVATWPVLTYLAFFWDPAKHCFLKPEFTKEYARRVGHRFAVDYATRPSAATYLRLIDMLEETRAAVADLEPRDNIDLHSFMWAVCMYDE